MPFPKSLVTICSHTIYEPDIKRDWLVLDLGANRGEFSQAMAQRYGCHCVAVEASPLLFDVIAADACVSKYNYAIWSKTDELDFNLCDNPESSSVLRPGAGRVLTQVKVPAVDLDTLAERHDLGKVDLMKVDIEGAEIAALTSASDEFLSRIAQITVEFHDFNGMVNPKDIQPIKQRLQRLGFFCACFSMRSHFDVLFLNTARTRADALRRLGLKIAPYHFAARRVLGLRWYNS